MYIGLTLEQYNECTPYELNIMIKQRNKKHDDVICRQAWLIAKLTTPKVPSFDRVFKRKDDSTIQHEGLAENKMHDTQIERHLKEFKEGGLQKWQV